MGAVPCVASDSFPEKGLDRSRLIEEQLPHVRLIARRIHSRLPRHIELDDLIQTGVLGLLEAMKKFDPSRKVELGAYARLRIQGAILDSLREQDWSPRLLRQKGRRGALAQERLAARLGHDPEPDEVAREIGVTLEDWRRTCAELRSVEVLSLDALNGRQGTADSLRVPNSEEESPFDVCFRWEMRALLNRALVQLTEKRRQVLALYYAEGLTMKEVGRRLGVCESRVSQIRSSALEALGVEFNNLLQTRGALGQSRDHRAETRHPARAERAGSPLTPSPSSGSEPLAAAVRDAHRAA